MVISSEEVYSVVHLRCPKCNATLQYNKGKFGYGDYYCCPKCNGKNYPASDIIFQMAQYISHLEKPDETNPQK